MFWLTLGTLENRRETRRCRRKKSLYKLLWILGTNKIITQCYHLGGVENESPNEKKNIFLCVMKKSNVTKNDTKIYFLHLVFHFKPP